MSTNQESQGPEQHQDKLKEHPMLPPACKISLQVQTRAYACVEFISAGRLNHKPVFQSDLHSIHMFKNIG